MAIPAASLKLFLFFILFAGDVADASTAKEDGMQEALQRHTTGVGLAIGERWVNPSRTVSGVHEDLVLLDSLAKRTGLCSPPLFRRRMTSERDLPRGMLTSKCTGAEMKLFFPAIAASAFVTFFSFVLSLPTGEHSTAPCICHTPSRKQVCTALHPCRSCCAMQSGMDPAADGEVGSLSTHAAFSASTASIPSTLGRRAWAGLLISAT